mgnify:CR=1 FL=1
MDEKILLIDDETAIRDNLAPFLERSGFQVQTAGDGEAGMKLLESYKPALVVLDVLMPHLNGREVLRRLRQAENWTPVILLTQVGDAGERAMALEEGADDYLNKPFDPHELVARIKTVLRRVRPGQPPLSAATRLASGDIVLDRSARRVRLKGQEIILTPKAVSLLEYLMTHAEELIARDRLVDAVWGWDYPTGLRAVDTRIAELRKALGDNPEAPRYIETVVGEGYRYIASVESA